MWDGDFGRSYRNVCGYSHCSRNLPWNLCQDILPLWTPYLWCRMNICWKSRAEGFSGRIFTRFFLVNEKICFILGEIWVLWGQKPFTPYSVGNEGTRCELHSNSLTLKQLFSCAAPVPLMHKVLHVQPGSGNNHIVFVSTEENTK